MTEDRIRRAFDLLDGRAAPPREFADDLFDRLLEETKLRPSRFRPRLPQPTPGRPELRRILTIAAAAVITAVVFAVALAPFRDLIGRRGTAAFDSSTAFRATIEGHVENPGPIDGTIYYDETSGDFSIELDYRSLNSWRIVALAGSALAQPLTNENVLAPGDFVLRDGDTLYSYSSGDNTYTQTKVAKDFSPLNLLGFTDPTSAWPGTCAGAQTFPDEQLAGRTAHHVTCQTSGSYGDHVDLWVDVETNLILKIVSHLPATGPQQPTPVPGPFKFEPGETIDISQLEYDPAFAEGTFTFTPPPGSKPANAKEASAPPTTLPLGAPVPTWTAPLLGGGTLDLASLGGRPTALYFWATWCVPCVGGSLDAFDAEAAILDRNIGLVSVVSRDLLSAYSSYVADHGYTVPVARDDDGSITRGLGLLGIPALVLLDADGNLAGVYVGDLSGKDITTILETFAAGKPLPDVGGSTAESLP